MTTTNNTDEEFNMVFNGIGCSSVEDIEISSFSGGFFSPEEGANKIRFLQGPILSYISQEWEDHKPVGEKKKYLYNDPQAKKDPNAKLIMTFLIYSYKQEKVLIWDIGQKSIQEDIKNINSMQPDLSAFDIQITKSKKTNGYYEYKIAQGQNKPFTIKEAIDEVIAKGIIARLEEFYKKDETNSDEETAIANEIASKSTPATPKDAEEAFQ